MSRYPNGSSGYNHPNLSGYGYSSSSGAGHSSSPSRRPSRAVSPLGQSRFEGSSRYHTSRRTYDVTPQPDFSRRESELAQLGRTKTLSRRPSDNYGASGVDISSYGGGAYNPYSSSSKYTPYRPSESSRFSTSAFRDVNYQQASSTYRASPSSSRAHQSSSASSRPSDVYVPDPLRIGRSDARYDERYFSASPSYSTHDVTPSSTSGLRRSGAQRRRRR
ncbi:hypothetical protein AC578_10093 [Pseudocercospora eumusae]|uniref:Uncharacterized protein n=1 Tax=Pseudocercospora eumusae TaxID=321146 RepID=A0A139GWT9_9PEZI|nr:hypothetical protein AC578_10093 [Pseudocercospora eumusae]